jgi:hypothetical protein
MQVKQLAEQLVSPDEQREFERVVIELPGKLFVPADETTIDCHVLNLSGDGACVRCEAPMPLHSLVVLYVDGFGRFDGITTRSSEGELGLEFVCKEEKRNRLLADIAMFVNDGIAPIARMRRHPRASLTSVGHFRRSNGELVRYEVLDFSSQGISVRTNVHPQIGEIINLGKTCGRVVRHHSDGIAVHFLVLVEPLSHGN